MSVPGELQGAGQNDMAEFVFAWPLTDSIIVGCDQWASSRPNVCWGRTGTWRYRDASPIFEFAVFLQLFPDMSLLVHMYLHLPQRESRPLQGLQIVFSSPLKNDRLPGSKCTWDLWIIDEVSQCCAAQNGLFLFRDQSPTKEKKQYCWRASAALPQIDARSCSQVQVYMRCSVGTLRRHRTSVERVKTRHTGKKRSQTVSITAGTIVGVAGQWSWSIYLAFIIAYSLLD